MNDGEVIELLRRMEKCNFIACAISPWHANGIDASINLFKDKGVSLSGFIFMSHHPVTGKCITEDNFTCNSNNIQFIDARFESKSWREKICCNVLAMTKLLFSKNKGKHDFYVFMTSYPDYNWINIIKTAKPDSNIKYVIVDEGCGGYFNNKLKIWVSSHISEESKSAFFSVNRIKLYILGICRIIPKKIMLSVLKKSGGYYNHNLFLVNKGQNVELNETIAVYYKKVFDKMRLKISLGKKDDYKNSVLINTQCLMEDGAIDRNQDMQAYCQLFEIVDELGLNVLLKRHPRELNPDRYKEFNLPQIKETKYSQEVLISEDNKPLVVVGIYTSSLVTLKVLYNVPSISLARMVLNNGVGERLQRDLGAFYQIYKDTIMFPKNKSELRRTIEKIFSNS